MSNSKKGYFSDVDMSMSFHTVSGKTLKTLQDLANFLEYCDEETFNHHVNKDKNDFALWIEHAINDSILANDISPLKDKKDILKRIKTTLYNVATLNDIESQLSRKLNIVSGLIENKELEIKKSNQTGVIVDVKEVAKLRDVRELLEDVEDRLKKTKIIEQNEASREYVRISDDLAHITKILAHQGINKNEKDDSHFTKEEAMLLEIMRNIDAIIRTNHELYEQKQKIVEENITKLKDDLNMWKIGDVADHQEIKSVFLSFENNMEYKLNDLQDVAKSIYDGHHVDEKIKRHTTLINALDKELFDLKKEVKINTEHIIKLYTVLKEMAKK